MVVRGKPGRIASLDVARGWLIVVSVSTAAALYPRPDWINHANWFGITPYDLIFPAFVTLSGIGMSFAYKNRVGVKVTLRRIVVLLLVGVIYGAVATGIYNPVNLRWTGTLQLYAGLVFFLALGHVFAKNWKAWVLITLVLAILLTFFYMKYASDCNPVGLSPECNPSLWLDGRLFGAHMYGGGSQGHDPEGIFSIIGALITAAAGTATGHMLLHFRKKSTTSACVAILLWISVVFVFGRILGHLVEPFKRLWTPPFALETAALGLLIFLVAYLIVDVWLTKIREKQKSVKQTSSTMLPFVALGRNSLLVYFGSHLLLDIANRKVDGSGHSVVELWTRYLSLGLPQPWGFVICNVLAWTFISISLHNRKIYIHA